jgi:predicted nucleotidyltransferase
MEGAGMKELADLQLAEPLRKALEAIRGRISAEFGVDRIVLFGSVVRGTADEESDVDLLIVLREPPDHGIRDRISSVILDINLEYDSNLSELIVDRDTWDNGIGSVLPIHQEIEEQGIPL